MDDHITPLFSNVDANLQLTMNHQSILPAPSTPLIQTPNVASQDSDAIPTTEKNTKDTQTTKKIQALINQSETLQNIEKLSKTDGSPVDQAHNNNNSNNNNNMDTQGQLSDCNESTGTSAITLTPPISRQPRGRSTKEKRKENNRRSASKSHVRSKKYKVLIHEAVVNLEKKKKSLEEGNNSLINENNRLRTQLELLKSHCDNCPIYNSSPQQISTHQAPRPSPLPSLSNEMNEFIPMGSEEMDHLYNPQQLEQPTQQQQHQQQQQMQSQHHNVAETNEMVPVQDPSQTLSRHRASSVFQLRPANSSLNAEQFQSFMENPDFDY